MHRNRLLTALLITLVGQISAIAIEPVNPNLSVTARKVLNYLDSAYGQKMLAGYNVYVHTPDDYEQTAMHAAIWGRDMQWLGDPAEMVAHAKRHRYILTIHWHWSFDDDSAWPSKRKTPVNVAAMVTPGTPEHKKTMAEISAAADKLQLFEDADIPILWRPLHEIDGGWFWWTDTDKPENTAKLWRMMYDYLTTTRKLDNLIWVYSAGVGNKTVEYRKRFYPGGAYVDISGIDIYGVDFRKDTDKYHEYYNIMAEVSPGKMLACGECDAIPDPVKTQSGKLPKWLYALPWWGAPSSGRPADWALFTMRHGSIVTLDQLPPFGPGNIARHVGILEPRDDGSAWFADNSPKIEAYATDRDGSIAQVTFHANGQLIATDNSPPYSFTWTGAEPGCYDVTAQTTDNAGETTTSNNIRLTVGMVDLALNKEVTASSGTTGESAVDGDYYTTWSADKGDNEWLYVDLATTHTIDRVNVLWGWKIHAADFSIDVATANPELPAAWKTVHTETDFPYRTWEATCRIRFAPTSARYVRISGKKRAGNQNWGGYQLAALEVPVARKNPNR